MNNVSLSAAKFSKKNPTSPKISSPVLKAIHVPSLNIKIKTPQIKEGINIPKRKNFDIAIYMVIEDLIMIFFQLFGLFFDGQVEAFAFLRNLLDRYRLLFLVTFGFFNRPEFKICSQKFKVTKIFL